MIMKIAVNAVNARSFGISQYTKQLVAELVKLENVDITLWVNSEIEKRFVGLKASCDIIVVPFRIPILRLLYMQCVLPLKLHSFDVIHSVGNLGNHACFKNRL